jgi:hypothetical protein
MGCMDETACNYNSEANMADGTCEFADEGYDCEGNITAQIGDYFQGGILFYVDESGEHGLISAQSDLGQFEWGCYGEYIDGADGESIGTGYQNTLDIVAGCSETSIAASIAIAYESGGYNDWYLPSRDELYEMYNTIGNGSMLTATAGNIGSFISGLYWSSSEVNNNHAWLINFYHGNLTPSANSYGKGGLNLVRVIRSF